MKMKYITFIDRESGDDDIIVFTWRQIHKEVARRLRLNVRSAGFIDIYNEDGKTIVTCYGKSESIGVSSQEGDTELAARYFKL